MVEVPKELQKFNINVVYCGIQPNTHTFLVKKIANQILVEEKIWKEVKHMRKAIGFIMLAITFATMFGQAFMF